jgi:two-component system response regulator YesN
MILAEDEELVRRAIIATTDWESKGFNLVAAAKDGGEALSLICTGRPDLVVTDIRMPILDGISLIKMVTEEMPADERPLFIVLTAHGDFDYARQSVKLGVIDFLMKPLDDEELAASLDKAKAMLDKRDRTNRLESLADMDGAFRDFSPDSIPPATDPQDAYADRAAQEIKLHYVSDLTMEDVAARLSISPGYLSRIFKKRTGQTFYDYLSFVRMRVAMELLADPTLRVQEVADRVGYADQRSFSQRFRQIVGCTPSEFRQGKAAGEKT